MTTCTTRVVRRTRERCRRYRYVSSAIALAAVALGIALHLRCVVGDTSLALPPSFTAVNWSLVSPPAISAAETALTAPIGCTCTSASSSDECIFFECKCACDLTAGACDPFCCCDIECSEEQIAATTNLGLCTADSVATPPSIEYCATDMTLGRKSASVNALVAESVLCVAVDNNEVAGEFFAAAPEEHMTVATAFLKNPKEYSFVTAAAELSTTGVGDILDLATAATRDAYAPGDVIRTFAATSDAVVHSPVLSGFGSAIGSNECWELWPVRFEFPLESTTCIQKAVDLERVCSDPAGVLSAAVFAQNIRVAKWPNVTSSSTADSAKQLLAIEVEVLELDLDSGVARALETPYPSYFPHPEFVRASSNKTVSVCRGALLQLEHYIFHDSRGHIERVFARVTIGNIPSSVASSTPVDIAQTFSVTFESVATLGSNVVSLAHGNVQTYERSGNPGYLRHYPVRVGVAETNSASAELKGAVVISEMVRGLQVAGLGECSSAVESLTVAFGEDTQTSCALSMSVNEFRAFCKRSNPLPPALRVNFTRIAAFGNSDPFLAREWLELDYDAPTKSSASLRAPTEPDTVELLCQDLITAVHYEFLIASVGPVNNPQQKIVAARAYHSKESWRFWVSSGSTTTTERQTFLLRTTVSFVNVKTTELEALIPPAPPIWFAIPNDVFYPFILNDARATAQLPWSALLMLWFTLALLHV